jgi:hypothetical protein
MPIYFPVDSGVNFECFRSDLAAIPWEVNALDGRLPASRR